MPSIPGMQITSTTGFLSVASPAATATQLLSWQTGQQMTEEVLAQSGQQSVSLRIGDQTVEAHTSIALPPRAQLQLEVMQGGAQPILRISTAPPVGGTHAARESAGGGPKGAEEEGGRKGGG